MMDASIIKGIRDEAMKLTTDSISVNRDLFLTVMSEMLILRNLVQMPEEARYKMIQNLTAENTTLWMIDVVKKIERDEQIMAMDIASVLNILREEFQKCAELMGDNMQAGGKG